MIRISRFKGRVGFNVGAVVDIVGDAHDPERPQRVGAIQPHVKHPKDAPQHHDKSAPTSPTGNKTRHIGKRSIGADSERGALGGGSRHSDAAPPLSPMRARPPGTKFCSPPLR